MNFQYDLNGITPQMLEGFFDGWPDPPSPEKHMKLLANSSHIVVATDAEKQQVIGFITAISDGVLSAYIPLLEVLPAHKNDGIGSELVRLMLDQLKDYYMVDLCCDDDLVPYYEKFGMYRTNGMIVRHYARQSGE
ncbi:GNAT family N-acetyltransferase [Jeotgalibacillus salarius]|uniref:GNAT family N-acetyltransferase n=1 Tax=Jeotgalibacillus salarius TaxID=546023 RepID=A0A4Y8LJ04_9BACL|nr:GNAT family N-acetyltransferase [Jeotgalibacillus salarius]TFE02371.1 GNAT family N-acetyltransferase [Jeotgalibacillus salarius]